MTPGNHPPSGTCTDPLQQRLAALDRANQARLDGHHIKHDLARAHITFDQALKDPRAQACRVLDLIKAQYRWGPSKAASVARTLNLGANVRVRDLTEIRVQRIGHEVAARNDQMARQRAQRERLHGHQEAA